ncbi:PREDICTED: uncharacterized protein LOC108575646 [Habropoda laboriosa]|uniref:uncharacterized protein LOC108575646 n=1 Tax=Habropoda laboriosa TaxID=597456 RepID=UPI00083E0A3E|nr:PREDICTED: uncharacterized protein LOC108575646 [Habropoda laboriosa]
MSLTPDDQLDYKLLTQEKIQEALDLQAETMLQENLAIGLGMFEEAGAPEEMRLVFKEVIKDGATLIAVDRKTNELAAVAFNIIHARPKPGEEDKMEVFVEENLRHRSTRQLVKFVGDIESSVDIFDTYNVHGVMELFYLGTNPRYQGRGIGLKMVQKCIELGRGLLSGSMRRYSFGDDPVEQHTRPELIYGVFTSNYSQRIADTLGLEPLNEVRYEDFTFAGKKMSERIGAFHKTARLQILKF